MAVEPYMLGMASLPDILPMAFLRRLAGALLAISSHIQRRPQVVMMGRCWYGLGA